MTPELYQNLLDELGDSLFMISLYNWGEPLLNPHLADFIILAKNQDIYVDINTNLALELSDGALVSLLQSGVDNIVVSIDGFSQATYGQYRIGGSFELARRNITRLTLLRDQLALTTTITWKFLVFSFNEHEIAQAEQYCQNFGITFARKDAIIDLDSHPEWLPSHRKGDLSKLHGGWPFTRSVPPDVRKAGREATCAWHYCYSSINADGSVSPCCAVPDTKDDFGTVVPGVRTFTDVWNGDLFQASRAAMAGGGDSGEPSPICKHCPFPFLKDLSTGIDRFVIERFRQLYGTSESGLAKIFESLAAGIGFRELVEANPGLLYDPPATINNSLERGIVIDHGLCAVCGEQTHFTLKKPGFSLREAACASCGATQRNRDLATGILGAYGLDPAGSLVEQLEGLAHLTVFEAQADGAVHRILERLPGYYCAEFFDGVQLGTNATKGVRCENLEMLTFPDETFDMVITQDVFEHIADPQSAFNEIARVLKPGGRHIFTVPLHEGHKTASRARLVDGHPKHLMLPVYHGDPLRSSGSLVYTDFGDDLPDLLTRLGFDTEVVVRSIFYRPEELPWIDNPRAHDAYVQCRQHGGLLACLKYNSIVFTSLKNYSTRQKQALMQKTSKQTKESVNAFDISSEAVGAYWDKVSYNPGKTRWWQSPSILRHINSRVCGRGVDGFSQGLIEVIKRKSGGAVFDIGIAVACGTGQKEMNLIRQGVVKFFYLYDYSSQRVQKGKELAQMYGISNCVEFLDVDPLEQLPPSSVDFVYWNNALHHMKNTDKAVASSQRVLRAGGAFAMDDFIGPDRFQWSENSIKIASWVRGLLPERYLRDPSLQKTSLPTLIKRPKIEELVRVDPSEAADSSNIMPSIRKYFPQAEICMTGGVIYHLALSDVLANIDEEVDQELLGMLLKLDDLCSYFGENFYATAFARV